MLRQRVAEAPPTIMNEEATTSPQQQLQRRDEASVVVEPLDPQGDDGRHSGSKATNPPFEWRAVLAEWDRIVLLLILYTIQGIPMGLSNSVPFLLQHRVSYTELGVFSLVSLPFSLKVLWAPILDAVYVGSFGRRKSWLVPVQLVCVGLMVCGGDFVNLALAEADVANLTFFFGLMYFLMATQDIVVDGWALNLLSEPLRPLGSTCNGIGQTLGFSIAHFGFLSLQDAETCNRWFRAKPQTHGFVSLGSFLRFWGWVMLAATFFSLLFREEEHRKTKEDCLTVTQTYKILAALNRNSAVRQLSLLLVTSRMGFAAIDAAGQLMLIEAGVSKEQLALMSPLLVPLNLLSTAYVGRWTCGNRPLYWWIVAWNIRLALGFVWVAVIYGIDFAIRGHGIEPSHSLQVTALLLLVSALQSAASDAMFSSQMSFFSRIADNTIGGTYMTYLNTVSNVGHRWPSTVALWSLDGFRKISRSHGYLLQVCVSSATGAIWMLMALPVIVRLQALPLHSWLVHHRAQHASLPKAAVLRDEASHSPGIRWPA